MSDRMIDGELIGTEAVAARFREADSIVRVRLHMTMQRLGQRLRDRAAQNAPKGRTHALSKTIKARVFETQKIIGTRVGPPIYYGKWVEEGVSSRMVTVTRRVRSGDVRGIVGVKTTVTRLGAVLVSKRRGLIKKGSTTFKRHMQLRARPFMKPAMDSLRSEIYRELKDAVS